MRVSSNDERQSVSLQRDALIAAGVDPRHLHQDHASGARDNRPGLKSCLAELREGDVLIVWKLDRLGRSLSHLLRIIEDLKIRGIAFRSLTESIDTTTPHGSFLFNLFGTLAEYERRHCCKVSDEAAFCLIQRPYISKTLLTRRISPRGSP
ncbi:recombinase family protein [Escherichia coli]|uniref:recombinase family protein n=1 Tax=Escherichia coli TaxID=562 RepID=UPI003D2F3EB9